MRILVTGASGFVGRHLIEQLGKMIKGDDLVVAVSRSSHPKMVKSFVEYVSVDITDRSAVSRLVTMLRPTHTLHLAGMSSVSQAARAPVIAWQVNAVGSFNVAQALAEEAPGSTLLFVSSAEVYGRTFLSGAPLDESAHLAPLSVYARAKMSAEAGVLDIMEGQGRIVVLRPFNHTGPGQDERFVVPAFAAQVARMEHGLVEPVLRVGNLDAERDFLNVGDVVRAYIGLLLESEHLPERSIFNVASGENHKISTILSILQTSARCKFEVLPDPTRQRSAEIPRITGNAKALTAKTGWRPTVSWEKTVISVLEDWRLRVNPLKAEREEMKTSHIPTD